MAAERRLLERPRKQRIRPGRRVEHVHPGGVEANRHAHLERPCAWLKLAGVHAREGARILLAGTRRVGPLRLEGRWDARAEALILAAFGDRAADGVHALETVLEVRQVAPARRGGSGGGSDRGLNKWGRPRMDGARAWQATGRGAAMIGAVALAAVPTESSLRAPRAIQSSR